MALLQARVRVRLNLTLTVTVTVTLALALALTLAPLQAALQLGAPSIHLRRHRVRALLASAALPAPATDIATDASLLAGEPCGARGDGGGGVHGECGECGEGEGGGGDDENGGARAGLTLTASAQHGTLRPESPELCGLLDAVERAARSEVDPSPEPEP